jgi:hypothetical protein
MLELATIDESDSDLTMAKYKTSNDYENISFGYLSL